MMSSQAWLATAILLAALVAFTWSRVRPDVIAMAVVVGLSLTGVVTAAGALAGFSDPTVVTIAALYVVSAGLERTGIAVLAADWLVRAAGPSERTLIVILMALAGIFSAFMNIIGAMAMLLPVTLAVCRRASIRPSRLLLPLAIGARLGGALTLIGKPSNLIVSSLLVQAGQAPLSFFAFFPVGASLLAIGIVFMVLIGHRLLPARPLAAITPTGAPRLTLRETYRLPERMFRLHVAAGSPLAGRSLAETSLGTAFGITILAIDRGRHRVHGPSPAERLRPGDRMMVEARPEDVARLRDTTAVEVESYGGAESDLLEAEEVGLVEVVIAPRSDLAGSSPRQLEFRQRYGLTVVAIWRQGQPRRTWLADLPLQYGDALLLQGPRDRIHALRQDPNFISLDEPPTPRRSRMAPAVLAVVTLTVLPTTQITAVSVAALLAAGIVVLGGCVRAEEVFQAIDWRTVVVTGGLMPLGIALYQTGAAATLAGRLVPPGSLPVIALGAVLLVAFVIGHFIPSVPATIVVAPIALSAATALGVPPGPFLITVASATSVTLLTPISHPVSLMVMGPGGYRPGDYARLGAPLAVLLGATLLAVVSLVWRV